EKWPPDRHKCNKHWKPLEKSYVLELMEGGAKPLFIYKRMRASRNRQMKIWRESGGKGRPPNFEPPKIPPLDSGPSIPEEDLRKRHGKAEELYEAAEKRLKELEREAIQRQKRIAELEASAAEEQQKIDLLEKKQKKLLIDRREKAERLAQARAVIERRKLKEPERRRVLPESYEAEVLGLKPGTLIQPGKPGRPAIER